MDQEWYLSIHMTERYTLGPLVISHRHRLQARDYVTGVSYHRTSKRVLVGNEIEQGMVDTDDRISDK